MKCIVTAGPTCEPLDAVRRITNFSTGRLGCELAAYLTGRGHEVTLLVGEPATWPGERRAARVGTFSTTSNLRDQLRELRLQPADVLFHAAAVSDYAVGRIWPGTETTEPPGLPPLNPGHGSAPPSVPGPGTAPPLPDESRRGKIASRSGRLIVELVPTPKILAELRDWFPDTKLVGWKYELDGSRAEVIEAARRQLQDCRTDACVANGRAYGEGFGLVRRGTPGGIHLGHAAALYEALERFALG